jgi:hypothetical protein
MVAKGEACMLQERDTNDVHVYHADRQNGLAVEQTSFEPASARAQHPRQQASAKKTQITAHDGAESHGGNGAKSNEKNGGKSNEEKGVDARSQRQKRYEECMQLLLRADMDILVTRNEQQYTPLDFCTHVNTLVAKQLIRAGV